MGDFILHLSDPRAVDAESVGPKAANLAGLGAGGLPTPGGFALTAAAYRRQLEHIGIAHHVRAYNEADDRGTLVQDLATAHDGPISHWRGGEWG